MRAQDKILKHISLIKFKDLRVVQAIAYHPLLFAKRRMADPDDSRPIRIRYFGVFMQKFMRNKTVYQAMRYITNSVKQHPDKVLALFVDPDTGALLFPTTTELLKYVKSLFNDNQLTELLSVRATIAKAIGGE